jgi:hypothetical protein
MKVIKINHGEWTDLEHTQAVVNLQYEDDDGNLQTIDEFGLTKDDNEEITRQLWELIEAEQKKKAPRFKFTENSYQQILAGTLPVPLGQRVVERDGIKTLVRDTEEEARMTLDVRKRLDKYYSGYELAMAERSQIRAENRKRKIDALLAAEKLPSWPYVDLNKIEEEA